MVVFPLQAITILLPLFAIGQTTLFVALMAVGGTSAFLQVCLNVYAGRLEIARGVLVMNKCHGFWSLGLGLGSLIVIFFAKYLSPLSALTASAWVSAILGLAVAYSLPRIKAPTVSKSRRRSPRDVPIKVLLIAAMLFPVTMTEGAMADWAAIYMSEILPPDVAYSGLAVTVYAGTVTLGRFMGDGLKRNIGARALAQVTISIALVGLLLLTLPIPPFAALVGFAIVGLGVSVAFPLGVSAAAPIERNHEASNIALISTVAITGFLFGPPLIGFVAEATNLRVGLAALIPLLGLSLILAKTLNRRESGESPT